MALTIQAYTDAYQETWNAFVTQESMNGTFLQSRFFLNYHPEGKFKDCSLMILKGNALAAVIPACQISSGEKVLFCSHKGSSYGGIVIKKTYYTVNYIAEIIQLLEAYLRDKGFTDIFLKMTPDVYAKIPTPLIDYFLYQNGYREFSELNFYCNLDIYQNGVAEAFSSNKRRECRASFKNNLTFQKITEPEGIAQFYDVLRANQQKLGISSVHTLDELKDLKYHRLADRMDFYGVYLEQEMIAGSMVFRFHNTVFHTQYLASLEPYLNCYPMHFLLFHLISQAISERMHIFSFGICTEDRGAYLNMGLARFKEGFGASYGVNKSYEKDLTTKTI